MAYDKVKSWEKDEVKAVISGDYPEGTVDMNELADELQITLNSSLTISFGSGAPDIQDPAVTTVAYYNTENDTLYIDASNGGLPVNWHAV